MDFMVVVKIAGLMIVVTGVIIFFLHRALISSTEGAVNRLNEEIAKTNKKQAELTNKLKEADEELEKRRAEAKTLTDQLRSDAEEETKKQREEIVGKARTEGEEIITKAQNAAEKFQLEVEKELDCKGIDLGLKMLNNVLSETSKGDLNNSLIVNFVAKLKDMDMSQVGADATEMELLTIAPIDPGVKSDIERIVNDKVGRTFSVKETTDPEVTAGVIIKFGSMAIDGSLRNLLREEGIRLKEEIQAAGV